MTRSQAVAIVWVFKIRSWAGNKSQPGFKAITKSQNLLVALSLGQARWYLRASLRLHTERNHCFSVSLHAYGNPTNHDRLDEPRRVP